LAHAARPGRQPAALPGLFERARAELLSRPPLAHVAIEAGTSEFVLLLARAGNDGMLDIVAKLDDDPALAERAMRRAAA
jgi:hypothetical protein